MKTPACLLLALTALSLRAQQPVAYSLTDALARIPLPPATVEEAAALTNHESNLQFGPTLNGLVEELGRETLAISTPAGVDDLQNPATIAKLEKMNDAEKVQFAMALQAKAASAQAARMRPGVVTAADTVLIKRTQAAQQAHIQRMQNLPRLRAAHDAELLQKLQEEHQRIDQEAEAGLAKLGHDGDNIDPAKLRAHEAETWKKHLAAENAYLAGRRAEWTAYRDSLLPELKAVDADLKAGNYGGDSSAFIVTLLTQYQLLGMGDLRSLLETASQDVIHAAEWQERFTAWQKSG